jgi:hypothetical protein
MTVSGRFATVGINVRPFTRIESSTFSTSALTVKSTCDRTFDMSGRRKRVKPACVRPLDGGFRRHLWRAVIWSYSGLQRRVQSAGFALSQTMSGPWVFHMPFFASHLPRL